MSSLMDARVDWTRWAATQPERTCPACGHKFKPNHPRRQFCGRGLPECPGRQRRRQSEQNGRRRPRQQPKAGATMHGFFADALIDANARPAAGTANELILACSDLARAVRAQRPAFVERALAVRVLTIAAARAVRHAHTSPAGDTP